MKKKSKIKRNYRNKFQKMVIKLTGIKEMMLSGDLRTLIKLTEKELNKRYNIVESSLLIQNPEYEGIIEIPEEITNSLSKEIQYLDEEGILNWVRDSKTIQIVPSPFSAYGKSTVIIFPIIDKSEDIGFLLLLSNNERLQFSDSHIESIDAILNLFSVKLLYLMNEYSLKKLDSNIKELENLILNNIKMLNTRYLLENSSKKINQAINNIKSNLDLIDPESELFFTRMNKISSEVNLIDNINDELKESLSYSLNKNKNIESNVNEIIDEALSLLQIDIQRSNVDINFVKNEINYQLESSKDKFLSAFINLIVYIIDKQLDYTKLNIYTREFNNEVNISLVLAVENFSTYQKINLENNPEKQPLPKELEVTKIILSGINSDFQISYLKELGYFYTIKIKKQ